MLKERPNQGLIANSIIGSIFLIIAGVTAFFTFYLTPSSSVQYAGDQTKNGLSASMDIYNIGQEPIGYIDDNKTEIWLVQYKTGYAGIQVKENDKQIADIVAKAKSGELEKKPARVTGKFFNTNYSNKDEINQYSSFMRQQLSQAEASDILANFDDHTYLSISVYEQERLVALIAIAIFASLGLGLVIYGFYIRKRNIASYQALYAAYPELRDNFNLLAEAASFHDEELKIIVYNHHLITYFKRFNAVDLDEVERIYHHIVTTRRGFIVTSRLSNLVVLRPNKKKFSMFIRNIGKSTDDQLQTTFFYINQHFPQILIGFEKNKYNIQL